MTAIVLLKEKIKDVLETLTDRERQVLEQRFGLSTDIAGPLRKWAASSKSLASAFARSSEGPAQNAASNTVGSSKVSLRRQAFEHNFQPPSSATRGRKTVDPMDNMEPEDDKELWDVLAGS